MVTIYALIDPRTAEIRYIGQTRQELARRLSVHLCSARKGGDTYSYRWMRSVLSDGLVPLIWSIELTDSGDDREKHWIEHYRMTCRLTNTTSGGDGAFLGPRKPLSEEHRAKIAEAIRGRKHSEESKARMCHPKPPRTDEHKKNLSASLRGRMISPETRAKISAANKGQKHSPEHIAKVAAAQKGKVIGDDLRAHWSAIRKGKPAPPRGPDHYKKAWETRRRNTQQAARQTTANDG